MLLLFLYRALFAPLTNFIQGYVCTTSDRTAILDIEGEVVGGLVVEFCGSHCLPLVKAWRGSLG